MTPAEKVLWQRLAERQVGGAYFRAQHAVDRFIVDFICIKARLVIEVDGDSHTQQLEYDAARTTWLEAQRRYRVLRFHNDQVFADLDAVVATIRAALQT